MGKKTLGKKTEEQAQDATAPPLEVGQERQDSSKNQANQPQSPKAQQPLNAPPSCQNSRDPKPKPRRRSSLQQRLIMNVGLLTLAGSTCITGWAAMQMRQQLIGNHKQRLKAIATVIPQELTTAQFSSTDEAINTDEALSQLIQASIEEITRLDPLQRNTLIWVRDDQQQLITQSSDAAEDPLSSEVLNPMVGNQGMTHHVTWGDRHFLACRRRIPWPQALESNNSRKYLDLYLAYDVTAEQQQITKSLTKLLLADLFITLILMAAIAAIVRKGLAPIARINRLAEEISASDLEQAHLEEDQAPEEIQALVEGFNAMLGRLSQAWDQQRQFVNDASHELRTPLAIVDGYLQSLLRRRQNLNPQQIEAVETAAEETQRTIQMLQEMLTIARADSGQFKCTPQPTLLQPLLYEVCDRTQQIYQRSVVLNLPEDPVTALIDTQHLHQILLYLLDNAVKYSDSQSKIYLQLASLPSVASPNGITISVIDEGIGIPPEQQHCIFERFYRADEARHRKGGTGLGLSLAKTLIEAMGGRITVESILNQGSTFTLYLPSVNST